MKYGNYIYIVIRAILLIITFVWIYLLFRKDINYVFKAKIISKRYRIEKKITSSNKMYIYLTNILETVFPQKDINLSINIFFIVTLGMFITIFILMFNKVSLIKTIIFSLLFAMLPYLFIRFKLKRVRIEASYQVNIIDVLINNYKVYRYDMYEAIDKTITQLEQNRMKEVLLQLSIGLKDATNENDKKLLIDKVIFSVNTYWMLMLANNIYMALTTDAADNVLAGLEDVQNRVRKAYDNRSKESLLNLETKQLIILALPAYLSGMYIMVKYIGIPIDEFLRFQFNNNFSIFIAIGLLYVINLIILINMKKNKFDIS